MADYAAAPGARGRVGGPGRAGGAADAGARDGPIAVRASGGTWGGPSPDEDVLKPTLWSATAVLICAVAPLLIASFGAVLLLAYAVATLG